MDGKYTPIRTQVKSTIPEKALYMAMMGNYVYLVEEKVYYTDDNGKIEEGRRKAPPSGFHRGTVVYMSLMFYKLCAGKGTVFAMLGGRAVPRL